MFFALICATLCISGVVVRSEQIDATSNLPKTSGEFFALFTSKGADETLELMQIDKGKPFTRWVLWSIHIVDKPHWRIENKSHARVFDLLNWSRQQGLMPRSVHIDKICHKGMEHLQEVDNGGISIPPKPKGSIPTASWDDLWISCHKKLSSKERTASNCIDIPGVVVSSSNPDKPNNPCNKEYRMVDGAHRMCLRKYAIVLLEGEVAELQSLLTKASGLDRQDIIDQITSKRNLIDMVSNVMVFDIDQETFGSMLMTSHNPVRHHQEWANKMQLSQEVKDEWKFWMRRVLAFVHDRRDYLPNDIENKGKDEL